MNGLAQTGANLLAQTGSNGLAQSSTNALSEIQTFAWLLAVVCLGIVGIMFITGAQSMTQHGKKWLWFIVIGLFIAMGAGFIIDILKINISF